MTNIIELLRLSLCLAVTVLIGYSLLAIILRKSDIFGFAEKLALSYGLGIGAAAFQMLIYYFFKIPYTSINFLIFWAPVAVAALLIRPSSFVPRPSSFVPRPSFLDKFLIGAIFFEVILAFFRAFLKPLESFDSIAMYAIRSKIIFTSGIIPDDFFTNLTLRWPNADYPLLLPLAQVWVYDFLGGLNDLAVKVLFPAYFLSFLACFYFLLKRSVPKRESLIFTFILASIPQVNRFATNGYADLLLAYYYAIGVMLLLLWMREGKAQSAMLSGLFLGFAVFTKNEGSALFLITALILAYHLIVNRESSVKKLFGHAVIFLSSGMLVAAPSLALKLRYGLDNNIVRLQDMGASRFKMVLGHLDRIPVILYEFQKHFFGPKKWNIVWLVFFLVFFLNIKKAFKGDLAYVTMAVFATFLLYAGVYIMIPVDGPINWYLGSAVSRLFIHIVPLAVLWIALSCRERGLS